VKVALKLLLWYLCASLGATLLSFIAGPAHAHAPSLVILAFFPVLPPLLILDALRGRGTFESALSIGVFLILFCVPSYFTLRRRKGGASEPAA
jgi:hypothetical protein